MKRWRAILAHAFAVEKPGPAKPTPAEAEVVDRVLREVVRRKMTMPASIFLESVRPMTYLGSQAMHFFSPFMSVLIEPVAYKLFSSFMEKRGAAEYLINRMEALQSPGDSDGTASSDASRAPTTPSSPHDSSAAPSTTPASAPTAAPTTAPTAAPDTAPLRCPNGRIAP
ncbi:MAG: hypothetical protein KF724_11850 [Phycisphaeraceae bacterium]|nr:hypothetical protein [Phycisphaeraceae bacterium]